MITTLNVPFEKKEEFKEICRHAGFTIRKNNAPDELNTYRWLHGPLWEINATSLPRQLFQFRQTNSNRIHVLETDYQGMLVATKLNANWDKSRNITTFNGPLPQALEHFRPRPYSYYETLEKQLNRDAERIHPAIASLKPHPHQLEAAKAILNAWANSTPGFLLADSTGLGKRLSTWTGVLQISQVANKPLKILIVSTPHGSERWRQTIIQMGNGGHAAVGNQISIVTYQSLPSLFHQPIYEKKQPTTKPPPLKAEAEHFDILVLDESHNLQPTDARVSKLARKLETKAGFTIWISAIAGENPLEAKYLTTLIAHTTSKTTSYRGTYESWCLEQGIALKRAGFSRWTWIPRKQDVKTLHEILFANSDAAIKRCPADINDRRTFRTIKISIEANRTLRDQYQTLWKQCLETTEEDATTADANLLKLRADLSHVRISSTIALTEDLICNGYQVAICLLFSSTVTQLRAELIKKGYHLSDCTAQTEDNGELHHRNFLIHQTPILLFEGKEPIVLSLPKPEDKMALIVHDLHWDSKLQTLIHSQIIPSEPPNHEPLVYLPYIRKTFEEHATNILLKIIEPNADSQNRHCTYEGFHRLITSTHTSKTNEDEKR
jgi:hypothetical protein